MSNLLTDDFDPEVFRCRSGAETPPEAIENLKRVHVALLAIKALACGALSTKWGAPVSTCTLRINSGYRTPNYNAAVYKSHGQTPPKDSQHPHGKAADFTIDGLTPKEVQAIVDDAQRRGVIEPGGMGSYPSFTHLDVRGFSPRPGDPKHLARWSGTRTDSQAQP